MRTVDVDAMRVRAAAVRQQLVDAIVRSTAQEDVDVAVRVLGAIRDALAVDVERLMREIPSDATGNPLPSGEHERLLWSAANKQLEEITATYTTLTFAAERAVAAGEARR